MLLRLPRFCSTSAMYADALTDGLDYCRFDHQIYTLNPHYGSYSVLTNVVQIDEHIHGISTSHLNQKNYAFEYNISFIGTTSLNDSKCVVSAFCPKHSWSPMDLWRGALKSGRSGSTAVLGSAFQRLAAFRYGLQGSSAFRYWRASCAGNDFGGTIQR